MDAKPFLPGDIDQVKLWRRSALATAIGAMKAFAALEFITGSADFYRAGDRRLDGIWD